MTRGKHGRAAAQRRAQSAQDQLEELLPKLVDARRLAAQYKSEAEAAPILRRQLAELKGTVGVPEAEHVRIVAELDETHQERLATIEESLIEVFTSLGERGGLREPTKEEWINAVFMDHVRQLPRDAALTLLRYLGFERHSARAMLDPGLAQRVGQNARSEALAYARMAAEQEGRTDGLIPGTYIHGPGTVDEVIRRHTATPVEHSPLDVQCPTCAALSGRDCRTSAGLSMETVHNSRERAVFAIFGEPPDE